MVEAAREQWLEDRRHSIGASEVPTIMGCNPWDTPLQLYLRKRGEIPDKEETEAMKMGHKLEPVIAELYEEETSRKTGDLGAFTIQRNPEMPHAHCTLDRRIMPCDGHDMPGCLEIKAPGGHMAPHWEEGAPLYVQVQVQAQLAITKMEWGSIAALLGGQRFVWVDVERHEDAIAEIRLRVAAFWKRIDDGNAPPVGAADTEALRQLFPKHAEGKVIELPQEAGDIDAAIKRLTLVAKDTADALEEQRNCMKRILGDAERGVLPDGSGSYSYRSTEIAAHQVKAQTRRTLRRVKV